MKKTMIWALLTIGDAIDDLPIERPVSSKREDLEAAAELLLSLLDDGMDEYMAITEVLNLL